MSDQSATRRNFVKTGSAVAAASLAGLPSISLGAENTKKLRIGVVGCGGRGGGAVIDALKADPNTELWAMGDLYMSPMEGKLKEYQKHALAKERLAEGLETRLFDGLDSYQKVIDSGIDVVLLTAPPAFRPEHFEAAVNQGVHTFVEKPIATDIAGIHRFGEAAKIAAAKDLSVLCGFCYRYSTHGRELFSRLHDGAIGDVLSVHSRYYGGPVKPMPSEARRPDGIADTEWQIKNWYNFAWLGGDGIVEQACHNVDRIAWLMQDADPLTAYGVGGRQRPNESGNIYDHFSITYEFPNEVLAHVEWRQFVKAHDFVGDTIIGSKGVAKFRHHTAEIRGNTEWRYRKPRSPKSMYVLEHEEFFTAIRSSNRKDDADWVAHSTTMAIQGRNACYTGKKLTWNDTINSNEKLVPDTIDLNAELPIRPIPIPGITA